MELSRKDFLKGGLAVVAAAAGIAQVGCSDDDDDHGHDDAGTSGAGGSTGGSGGSAGGAGGSGGSTGGRGGSGGAGGSTGGAGGSTGGTGGSTGGTGGSTAGTAGTGGSECADPAETIAANHPAGMEHTLTVPPADVTAGTEKTYSIMGNSLHTHSITLTAANFTTLQGGGSVTVASTTGAAHTHMVTVSCA
jgi:hypothetical protein